jgi:hypothetical protein
MFLREDKPLKTSKKETTAKLSLEILEILPVAQSLP